MPLRMMLHAAKAMVVTAVQLIDESNLLAQAKVEFEQINNGSTFKAAIPEGAEPSKPYIRSYQALTPAT